MIMMSNSASPKLVALGREECLRLLTTAAVGRVVVMTPDGTPVIRPVNYAFDEASRSVVFRCGEGTKLVTLLRASRAWFEVDEIDPAGATAWSVIIAGVTEAITRPEEVRRLEGWAPHSWVAGPTAQWIRIRTRVVSGRRIDSSVAVTEPRP
jgi:nitroimidazol reductase NimA-like FMN-containing flavoprotein (pyridoxamine 5'-phosphate oxidase superfamily)